MLIANDEAVQLFFLERLFQKQGFEVVTVINGQLAFEEASQLKTHPKKMFDLIVLDLNMPVSDGLEALKLIKKLYLTETFRCSNLRENGIGSMHLVDYMPHFIAVSAFIDSDKLAQLKLAGFNQVFEMPLSVDQIKNDILPQVEERAERIEYLANLA